MDRIWAVKFNDGPVDAYSVEHPAPAMPYVMEWDVEKRITELEARIKAAEEVIQPAVKLAHLDSKGFVLLSVSLVQEIRSAYKRYTEGRK